MALICSGDADMPRGVSADGRPSLNPGAVTLSLLLFYARHVIAPGSYAGMKVAVAQVRACDAVG